MDMARWLYMFMIIVFNFTWAYWSSYDQKFITDIDSVIIRTENIKIITESWLL